METDDSSKVQEAADKLPPNAGKGRVKGVPNKATSLARQAIADFVDRNTSRMEGWLDQIAEKDPQAAFNCVRDLIEYHVPKLARTEMTGPDGKELRVTLTNQDANL